MSRFDRDHYLNTPDALLAQHRRRYLQRIHLGISDIEPRAKHSMPDRDKDDVQQRLLEQLVARHRRAFRGPLALRLVLRTTVRQPTQSHNIAKNLLDLFGRPRSSVPTRRSALLYADDAQVHALSVTCHHGNDAPMISGVATPLVDLLEDLRLAMDSARDRPDDDDRSPYCLDEALDGLTDMLRNEAAFRKRWGHRGYESMLWVTRHQAQKELLGRAAVSPSDLAMIYNLSGRALDMPLPAYVDQLFASSPLRIQLSELPQVTGASLLWEREIDEKLRAFQARFGWIVDPLVIPVALEVIIKPPPVDRSNAVHDLDNVLREYLIPRVVEILKPVSDYAFALDTDAPEHAGKSARRRKPPVTTKFGLTRYEAWRLPPADAPSKGFVNVAIVADASGHGDIFGQIDDEVDKWRESLEKS